MDRFLFKLFYLFFTLFISLYTFAKKENQDSPHCSNFGLRKGASERHVYKCEAQTQATSNAFANQSWNSVGISFIPNSNLRAYNYVLPNSLRLVVIPDYRNTIATFNMILDAGSDIEVKNETGLAHFFEHMMFRKTNVTEEGHYDRVLNSVGGSGNAGTGDSMVTFYSTFPGPAIETIIKLESERFLNLALENPYFTTEKGAVISERKLRVENDPFQRGFEILKSFVERGTPLEWMTIGSKQDVENMTLTAAKRFYKNFYTPDNSTLVIGGPFQPEYIKNLVNKYFGTWSGQVKNVTYQYPSNYLKRDLGKSFICSAPVGTKNFKLVYPSFDKSIKSLIYFDIFAKSMNNNPNGTLQYRLLKENLATDFAFYKTFWQHKSNPIIVQFNLSKDQNIDQAIGFWNRTLPEFVSKVTTDKMIEQSIKETKMTSANVSDKLTSTVSFALDNIFFLKKIDATFDELNILRNFSFDDYSQWVKKTILDGKYYTIGIVPAGEAKACEDYIQSISYTN